MSQARGADAARHPIDPDDAELAAETERVCERRYLEHFEEVRSVRGVAGLVGLAIVLVGIASWDPIASVLGVSWRAVGLAMLAQIAVMLAATWAAKRHGILSRTHRALERCESVVTTAVGAGLIWTAQDASVPLWFIPAAQIAVAPSATLHFKLERALLVGVYLVLLPLAFAVSGKHASAWLTLFIGGTLWLVQTTLAAAGQQAARDLARTNLLRERMQRLVLDEQRARIARDLHDGLGAELSTVLWQVQALERDGISGAGRDKVLTRVRATLDELRRIVADLKQPDADAQAFARALEQHSRDLCGDRAVLVARAEGEGRIAGEGCGQVDMMVREAVRNALQHGAARRIELDLVVGEELVVEIRDDGVGLPDSALRDSRGGLAHLRARAAALDATIEFGALTRGTRVRICLPRWARRNRAANEQLPMVMG